MNMPPTLMSATWLRASTPPLSQTTSWKKSTRGWRRFSKFGSSLGISGGIALHGPCGRDAPVDGY